MSVTAAAVSAEPLKVKHTDKDNFIGPKDKGGHREDNRFKPADRDDKKRHDDRFNPKGHFEWKLVKEYKKIHDHWVVIKVWKYVWVPNHHFR
jgi:hypothetical protein